MQVTWLLFVFYITSILVRTKGQTEISDSSKKTVRELKGDKCLMFMDCYSCHYTQIRNKKGTICKWEKESCRSFNQSEKPPKYSSWWKIYDSCLKTRRGKEIHKKYCGDYKIKFPQSNVTLPIVNGVAGFNRLYCRWNFYNLPEDKDFVLEINKDVRQLTGDIFYIEREKPDGTTDFKEVSKMNNIRFIFRELKGLNVHYISSSYKRGGAPFTISCREYEKINYVVLFISLSVIISGVISFVILMVKFRYYWLPNNQIISENIGMENPQAYNNRMAENKEQLDLLFLTKLTPKPYKENLNRYQDVCSICLEAYQRDVPVVKLRSCNHIFHYECLYKSLIQYTGNPRCPNCNQNILTEMNFEISPENSNDVNENNEASKQSHIYAHKASDLVQDQVSENTHNYEKVSEKCEIHSEV